MKQKFLGSLLIALAALTFSSSTRAQRNVTPALDRDPVMEADANHNLDVAMQAFTPLKKAYKQVLSRFEETYAAYHTLSNIDEFLYIAGMSAYYLSDNRGKQKIDPKNEREKEKYAPEKLKQDAITYLTELVDLHPDSRHVPDAKKTLSELKLAK